MTMTEIIDWVGRGIDAVGVAVIVVGAAVTAILAIRDARAGLGNVYGRARRRLGRAILLGLELLVAADIVRTVAIEPTFESLGVLAVLVLIRTFLSLALEVELDGRWPWQPPRPGEPPEVTAPG
ncbi:MAG: DUF1622 domain-containing protein [Actinomycetes bacterium]